MSAVGLYAAKAAAELCTGIVGALGSGEFALPSAKSAVGLLFDLMGRGECEFQGVTVRTQRPIPNVVKAGDALSFRWDAPPIITERLHGTESTWAMTGPMLLFPSNPQYKTLVPFVSGQWIDVPGQDGAQLMLPTHNPLGSWVYRSDAITVTWTGAKVRKTFARRANVTGDLVGLHIYRDRIVVDLEKRLFGMFRLPVPDPVIWLDGRAT